MEAKKEGQAKRSRTVGAGSWIAFERNSHVEALRMKCRDFEELDKAWRLRFAR
jgi:hypothetical protein